MHTLATPITLPSVTAMSLIQVRNVDPSQKRYTMLIGLLTSAGELLSHAEVVVANGTSQGIGLADNPNLQYLVSRGTVETPTGYDDLLQAIATAGTGEAIGSAVESFLKDHGLLPPSA